MSFVRSLVLLSVASTAAAAGFDPASFNAPSASIAFYPLTNNEACVIPNTVPTLGSGQASSDQTKLCGIDFYRQPSIGICAKGNSTNPGVDVYDLPDGTAKESFEAKSCLLPEKKRPAKKIAKLKSTLTCSDTSSILAYYQVSQILGGIGDVPASAIRTMDLAQHRQITARGLRTAIASSWRGFQEAESSVASHPELFTADQLFVYGAISRNPDHDKPYPAFVGNRPDYDHGEDAFLDTPLYKTVASAADLDLPKTLEGAAQPLIAWKDTADMILIDTLLNQQDRFGNQARYTKFVWTENGELKFKRFKKPDATASADKRAKAQAEEAEMKAKGAVLVDTLLLKDNDCGVSKRNWMTQPKLRLQPRFPHGVLPTVRHMSAKTYHKFVAFADAVAKDPAGMAEYFQKQLLMTPSSWKSVSANIASARQIVTQNCAAGRLKLDLDLELHLGLKADFTASCE